MVRHTLKSVRLRVALKMLLKIYNWAWWLVKEETDTYATAMMAARSSSSYKNPRLYSVGIPL